MPAMSIPQWNPDLTRPMVKPPLPFHPRETCATLFAPTSEVSTFLEHSDAPKRSQCLVHPQVFDFPGHHAPELGPGSGFQGSTCSFT
eukprot:11733916-Heterocapsa_arctica.AAC.1